VYELAKEFGVESQVVLARLNGMGEFVRSASSTVEPSLIRRLRDEFASSARRDLRTTAEIDRDARALKVVARDVRD
jgi:hypothetical protein